MVDIEKEQARPAAATSSPSNDNMRNMIRRKFQGRKAHLSVRLEDRRGLALSVCGSGPPGRVRWKLHPYSANFGAKRYRVAPVAVEVGWIDCDL